MIPSLQDLSSQIARGSSSLLRSISSLKKIPVMKLLSAQCSFLQSSHQHSSWPQPTLSLSILHLCSSASIRFVMADSGRPHSLDSLPALHDQQAYFWSFHLPISTLERD